MRLTRLAGTAVGAGLVAVLNAGVMFACSQSGEPQGATPKAAQVAAMSTAGPAHPTNGFEGTPGAQCLRRATYGVNL